MLHCGVAASEWASLPLMQSVKEGTGPGYNTASSKSFSNETQAAACISTGILERLSI